MIKKSIFTTLLFLTILNTLAQVSPGVYAVFFNSKEGTPYSINQPEKFLSERAIQKRIKHNIEIDSLDLPANPAFIDSLKTLGATIRLTSKWFNFALINADAAIIQQIELLSFVSETHKKSRSAQAPESPKMPKFGISSEIQKNYPTNEEVQSQIKLNYLHQRGFTGKNIRIAIIDAGFTGMNTSQAYDHAFSENRIIAARNFASLSGIYSGHTHGAKVGSIMLANLQNQYQGAAIDAEYLFLRSENGNSEYLAEEYNWVAAAEFADSLGTDIINSSLGYTKFDWPAQNHTYDDLDGESTIISKAAGIAVQKGIMVVVSAGNLGYYPWQYVGVPADHPDVLTVGAVNINGNRSAFSSKGLDHHHFKPDIMACGELAPVVYNDNISHGSGTSYSSPLVAGAAACLWQAFPDRNNLEISNAIRYSGNNYPNGNNATGYGIANFQKAYEILKQTQPAAQNTSTAKIKKIYTDKQGFVHLAVYTPEQTQIKVSITDLHGQLLFFKKYNLYKKCINNITIKDTGPETGGQILIVQIHSNMISDARKIYVH